jgi:peptidoglycan/xylan/chitin deacetylase (PgdA/CDA1 family)
MVKKIAYLTIDDGPSGDFRKKIDYLDSKNIKAILFCVGKELEKFEDSAIYAIKKRTYYWKS